MNEYVLQVTNLEKSFGKAKILRGINFSLKKGDVSGLIGQNGAGKTTLLRLIMGLMRPSHGNVSLTTEKNYIGYIPQSCRFDGNSSITNTLKFFANIRNVDVSSSINLCKKLDLACDKKMKHLSPGQQKKMQLVIAMMGDPDLYVFDEPTAGLDPSATAEMIQSIRSLNTRGKSIIISSHILQDLDSICTSAVIMDRGNLIYNSVIESSYIVKTNPLSLKLLDTIKSKYSVTCNEDRTILSVKIDKDNISDFIKYLTSLSVDIYEVSISNVKNIVVKHMDLKGAI